VGAEARIPGASRSCFPAREDSWSGALRAGRPDAVHDDSRLVGSGVPRREWDSGGVPVGFERRDHVTKNTTSATAATARRIYTRVTVDSTNTDPFSAAHPGRSLTWSRARSTPKGCVGSSGGYHPPRWGSRERRGGISRSAFRRGRCNAISASRQIRPSTDSRPLGSSFRVRRDGKWHAIPMSECPATGLRRAHL
jgi:hypothetical protein